MLGITVLAAILACGKLRGGDRLPPAGCKIKPALGVSSAPPKKALLGSWVDWPTELSVKPLPDWQVLEKEGWTSASSGVYGLDRGP